MTYEHEGFYVGVYVPGRSESFDVCVQRTAHMFRLLKDVDQTFEQWFRQGWTLEEALECRLDLERNELIKAFDKTDIGDEVWWHLSAWNGLDDDSASAFHITCGRNPRGGDSVIFDDVQETSPTGDRLLQTPVMSRLLRALVSAWDPQMGIVMSHRHRETAFEKAAFEHRIGWINYFSHKLGAIPPLPSPVRTELVEDKGSLVILTPERFSTDNPAHVALSLRVSAELKNAGILRPLLPPP